jgi:hypothetical protein
MEKLYKEEETEEACLSKIKKLLFNGFLTLSETESFLTFLMATFKSVAVGAA